MKETDTAVSASTNSDLEVIETQPPDIDSKLLRHDLLAPLRAIDALSDFASEDLRAGNEEEARCHIERIHESVATARAIVKGMGRYEKASQCQAVESTDVSRLIHSVISEFEAPDDLTVVVDTNKIDGHRGYYLQRRALSVCLREIVQNAIIHRVREKGAVVVCGSIVDDDLHIRVKDDGAGINPEYWQVVFEPLRKIQHGKAKGVGLGLSIATRSARRHGGSVTIEESSPSGSELLIVWPTQTPRRRDYRECE